MIDYFELRRSVMEKEVVSKNFIEQIIEKDLAEGKYETICTRFPRNRTDICISDMQNPFC